MITSYPDKNSLREVFDGEVSISALKNICKENGIFLLSTNKKEVINTAHLFYWGFNDVNKFSGLMEDYKNYKKAFRLQLSSGENEANEQVEDDESDNFMKFYEVINSYRGNLAPLQGINFTELTIDGTSDTRFLKATIEYKKRRKGRVKLMDEVTQKFSFEVTQDDNKQIIIDFVLDDRNNINVAKTLIANALASNDEFSQPTQISLSTLATADRVELFDRFLTYTFKGWRVEAVKNIKVQKDANLDFDEDEEEIENNFLEGIESALFTGSGLRSNPIIVDAVEKGYFFPKATLLFEHRLEAIKLLVDISFNTDDLLLEISIVASYEIADGQALKHPISVTEQTQALQYFHGVISEIYYTLKEERLNAVLNEVTIVNTVNSEFSS